MGRPVRLNLRDRWLPRLVRLAAWELRRAGRDAWALLEEYRARTDGKETRPFAIGSSDEQIPGLFRQRLRALLFDVAERDQRLATLRGGAPFAEEQIVGEANRICAHEFDLLGSGARALGPEIDWHWDFKNDHRFSGRQFYRRVRPAPFPGGWDLKVPWELSRCHHFVRLGQAYWITGDERYARELIGQLRSWIRSNPWRFGVNWACTMEVALRAVNWLSGLALVAHSPAVDDDVLLAAAGSLSQHGRHIQANLEGTPGASTNSNHYVADLVGLAYLGMVCPFLDGAREWAEFAMGELWREILKQTCGDGADYEGSISYHRLVAEMYVSVFALCHRNGQSVPQAARNRMERMLEFTAAYSRPDGTIPTIGDADNGRLHRFTVFENPPREWIDHRQLLALGGALLGREDLVAAAAGEIQDAAWMLPLDRLSALEASHPPAAVADHAFRTAGIYILRGRESHLVVSAGGADTGGLGNHAHADVLSFDLAIPGQSLVVDPGAGVYTEDYSLRHRLRATGSHNTVLIDGQEQATIDPRQPFSLLGKPRAELLEWASEEACARLSLRTVQGGVEHTRTFVLRRDGVELEIVDELAGAGTHDVEFRFHLVGNAVVDREHDGWRVRVRGGSRELILSCIGAELEGAIERYRRSPSYGVSFEEPVAVFRGTATLPWATRFKFQTV